MPLVWIKKSLLFLKKKQKTSANFEPGLWDSNAQAQELESDRFRLNRAAI
jgi:hypothetical protein